MHMLEWRASAQVWLRVFGKTRVGSTGRSSGGQNRRSTPCRGGSPWSISWGAKLDPEHQGFPLQWVQAPHSTLIVTHEMVQPFHGWAGESVLATGPQGTAVLLFDTGRTKGSYRWEWKLWQLHQTSAGICWDILQIKSSKMFPGNAQATAAGHAWEHGLPAGRELLQQTKGGFQFHLTQ